VRRLFHTNTPMNNHRHRIIVVRIGIDKGLLLESCF
jgi:hypothetical protein